ncbi:hypothetical protein NUW58_g10603 [Xylaria curta]|uniref:Uncharacterized protein n=1 Tax=Xylaria curta TaxID=42375 RepID=A0ACC1MJ76_9PEZI|nr:hypothetical protein NUW58_g10603 [Xylaria curta]
MNFDSGTAYAESDADDEYERSLHTGSPVLATDSEISPTDSDGLSSTEHTPTTYGHRRSVDRLPETIISEWTAEECADFIATIDLSQYSDRFIGACATPSSLPTLDHSKTVHTRYVYSSMEHMTTTSVLTLGNHALPYYV